MTLYEINGELRTRVDELETENARLRRALAKAQARQSDDLEREVAALKASLAKALQAESLAVRNARALRESVTASLRLAAKA